MNSGKKIRELRKSKGLKLKDLANSLNISEQALSQYERNVRNINLEMLKKIAIALDVSLISLLDDPSEIIDKNGIFIDSLKSNNENLNFSAEDTKELSELICSKYENIEIFNKLFKSAIFEERYDYKFEELGSKYIAELYNFIDQMIKIKINEIKYKKGSK